MTRDGAAASAPTWSPDGERIYYMSRPPECNSPLCVEARVIDADGATASRVVGHGFLPVPTPDESAVLMTQPSREGIGLYRVPLEGGEEPEQIAEEHGTAFYPRVSPDGRYLLLIEFPDEGPQVVMTTYPASGRSWRVSIDGGTWPQWSADGKKIRFVQGFDLLEVDVIYEPSVRLSRPRKLFELQNRTIDMGPLPDAPYFAAHRDGERFVVARIENEEAEAARGIVVVQNWAAEFAE